LALQQSELAAKEWFKKDELVEITWQRKACSNPRACIRKKIHHFLRTPYKSKSEKVHAMCCGREAS
jgi:hypothetical protein